IVLFESGAGRFFHRHGQTVLTPGIVIYLTPLAYHYFEIYGGVRAWRLIQFDADAARQAGAPLPGGIIACAATPGQWRRLLMLADWQDDPAEPA
ncbi:hypothetical protein ABTE82_18925, partial [Acinetobacter baumannii]